MFCKKIGRDFPLHKKEIKRFLQENEELRLKNAMLSYQQDKYRELLKTDEDLVKAYETKVEELRTLIKELKMKNWCQETIERLELKKKNGYFLTEDEWEDYYYAKNVIQSEEAEIAYLNGEENY